MATSFFTKFSARHLGARIPCELVSEHLGSSQMLKSVIHGTGFFCKLCVYKYNPRSQDAGGDLKRCDDREIDGQRTGE